MRPTPSRGFSGFTLIEALVVIAITAILLAVGVPTFQTFTAGRAVDAHVAELSGAMRLARAEAIKRGVPVTLCQTNDPNAANPVCNNAANWATGWLVFVDRGTQGSFDAGDQLVQAQNALTNTGGVQRTTGNAFITFLPNGVSLANAAGRFCIRPRLPASDTSYLRLTREVVVSSTGATRLGDNNGCPT